MIRTLIVCSLVTGLVIFAKASNWFSSKPTAHAGKKNVVLFQSYWWNNFSSSYTEQFDPHSYSLDDNQFPECTPGTRSIYCEIYAQPDPADPSIPKMNTISSSRYRPW